MKVLIIEDSQDFAKPLKNFFSLDGHTNDHACTLSEAREFTDVSHYDMILLDIMLPDGNSVSLLPKLKSHFSCPIVAFTAKSAPAEIEALLDAGFVDVFTKPVDFDFFERKVRHLL